MEKKWKVTEMDRKGHEGEEIADPKSTWESQIKEEQMAYDGVICWRTGREGRWTTPWRKTSCLILEERERERLGY